MTDAATPVSATPASPAPSRKASGRVPLLVLLGLIASGVLALLAVTPRDYAWTVALTAHGPSVFVDLTRRTLFEGALPGFSDIPLIGLLLTVWLYLRAQRGQASATLRAWRPLLGYLLVSALAAGLGTVHSLKWLMGRARPVEVLSWKKLDFSAWYEFGPHFVDQGIYRGAFPSGHTAAAFVVMGLAYVLAMDPFASRRMRAGGLAVGLFALLLAVAMVLGAGMAERHWVSDGVGSVVLLWPVVHVIYFWVLRVPQQRQAWATLGHNPLPAYWELRFCGWGLWVLVCGLAVALGLRALLEQNPPVLSALVPLGLLPLPYGWMRLWNTYATLSAALAR